MKRSSINEHYTIDYSQPSEYRFSHDSVFLARRVFELHNPTEVVDLKVLDLCAGCGIVGLDFLCHCKINFGEVPHSIDFLEVQEVYQQHFQINLQSVGEVKTQCQFLLDNYNCLQQADYNQKYDLIVCNPPYFFPGRGLLSPSQFKNRCRFFIDSDLKNLLLGIANCLTPNGQAFLLCRDLPDHKWNILEEIQKIIEGKLGVEVLADIRGTHFVKLIPILLSP